MVFVILAVTTLIAIALPVQAQTGCTDSPENPTVVLALVGSAGALFSAVRARARDETHPSGKPVSRMLTVGNQRAVYLFCLKSRRLTNCR